MPSTGFANLLAIKLFVTPALIFGDSPRFDFFFEADKGSLESEVLAISSVLPFIGGLADPARF